MKKKIIILTQEYPFGKGESFLSDELEFYSKQNIEVLLVPYKTTGKPRALPSGISLYDNHQRWKGWFSVFAKAVMMSWFLKEALIHARVLAFPSARISFLFFLKEAFIIKDKLSALHKSGALHSGIIYSYWLGGLTGGAILFNRSTNSKYKIVSRAHGGDVYDYRYKPMYIPFRKFVLDNVSYIAVVSQDGVSYLKKRYPEHAGKIKCHYLGTREPGFVCKASEDGIFRIVSCSFVVPVKRLHLIVEALNVFQNKYPDIAMNWTHLGGGEHLDELKRRSSVLNGTITCHFPGNRTHAEIMEFYQKNPVDLFVNTSSSEGVPVAIMEAMSVGIPILATDVGGVKELVNENCGKLIPADLPSHQLAQTIFEMHTESNSEKRNHAIERWRTLFNYERNYFSFSQTIFS